MFIGVFIKIHKMTVISLMDTSLCCTILLKGTYVINIHVFMSSLGAVISQCIGYNVYAYSIMYMHKRHVIASAEGSSPAMVAYRWLKGNTMLSHKPITVARHSIPIG